MEKVYKLSWDLSHSGDPEKDAFHLPFKNENEFGVDIISLREFELPEQIYFQANFNLIPKYDYPLTSLEVPVVSKRILEILNSLGDFSFRLIPVIMIDDTYFSELFDANNRLNSNVPVNTSYSIIQIMSYTEVFDYENSIFEEDFILPVGHIDKLVLKKPQNGFPPIFRIQEKASEIFISKEAKEALELANIKGCVFEEVEVTPYEG
ncbi:MAG: hypothetical protein JEZ14_21995 [Marinilabiliaceae bacterium]|nr:hypothetical protein [Marinilabiliaceae bacterium]